MAIAEAGSLSYRIPQGNQAFIQPQAPVEPIAQAQGQAMLPPLNEDLAQIQGLTERYYDNYGQLKSYVEGMNAKGIDVTKPHYGDPAKMELFNTYKMLEANLITTSQQLKNEQKIRTQMAPQLMADKIRYAEGFDPRTQLIGTQNPEDVYYSTELEPGVAQAMKTLSENPMTAGDRQRQIEYFNQTNDELQARIDAAQNPVEKQRLQYQKDQLTKAYQATKLFAPPNPFSSAALGQRTKQEAAESFYRQVTNKKAGVFENPEYEVDKDFNVIVKDKGLIDVSLGSNSYTIKGRKVTYPKVIDYLYKKDGKTYAKFQQPDKLLASGKIAQDTFIDPSKPDLIKDEEITSNGVDLVRTIVENNQDKIGFTHADVLTALQDKKLLDPKTRYSKDEEVIDKENVINTPDSQIVKQEATRIQEDLKKKGVPKGGYKINLPNGQVLTIQSGWRGYYIEIDGDEQIDSLNEKQVVEYIRSNTDYFSQFVPKSSPATQPQQQGKTLSLQTIKSKVGAPGFEGYTEQELIDYYTSQGYTIK